jgi:hypothetical protein
MTVDTAEKTYAVEKVPESDRRIRGQPSLPQREHVLDVAGFILATGWFVCLVRTGFAERLFCVGAGAEVGIMVGGEQVGLDLPHKLGHVVVIRPG